MILSGFGVFSNSFLWYNKNPTHRRNQRLLVGTREPCCSACGFAITSRNTCKIKDFECFGEHCIINLGLRPAALPRIAPGAMKLWYNSREATIINFMARTIRSRSSLPSQWPIIPFRHWHHGIITSRTGRKSKISES